MKIGVLTFHNCINYGSYWQARCLVDGLRGLGHDAELLDHDAPAVRRAELRCALQPQLPRRSPRPEIARYATKTRRFFDAIERLPRSRRFALDEPGEAGAYDAILIGSDEVWNFRHPWYGFKPIFFGERLRAGRLASYAASFGNHDADHGIEPAWAAKLDRFDAISVRDENSRRLVHASTGRDPALVLDPCLQFPPPPIAASEETAPYLVVYGHGFPDWLVAAVRNWARANDLRIVSIGYHLDWADEQRIEAGPEEFSALIAGAKAVATNFFHGCVFALHHARPFVCAPSAYRFNKVRDLVEAVAAERHMVTGQTPQQTYDDLLATPLNPAIGSRIAGMRTQSSAYLVSALG
jgi:hypothetical protein